MTTPTAKLGGFELPGSSEIRWTFKEGVQPHEAIIDMIPGHGKALVDSGRPVALEYTVNGSRMFIENLWALDVIPSPHPHIERVRVADRRWMLAYSHFLRRMNMRRNVGFERVGQNNQVQLNPVVPEVWYWKWSLKRPEAVPPAAKWTVMEAMEDVLQAQGDFEKESMGSDPGFEIRAEVKKTSRKLSVENFVVDDSGDACFLRALSLVPESGLYVDERGKYIVFSKADGTEGKLIESLGPEVMGGGHARLVQNKMQRPREIEIRVSIEAEVRLDFIELGDGATQRDDALADKRQLKNVLVVPDFALTVDGNPVAQGTYMDLEKLINSSAWANPPNAGSKLTHRFLERAAIPYLDLWGKLQLLGTRQPDRDWVARVGAINAGWRRLFQIYPVFMDRVLSIKAYRVGLVSPVNGVSGKAAAYCDHSFIGTTRSYFKNLQGNQSLEYAMNVDGYPTGAQVPGDTSPIGALSLGADDVAAPARVSVEDEDQGVIRVDFMADPNHMYEAALPGQLVRADGSPYTPTANAKDPRNGSPTFDAVVNRQQIPKLSSEFKLALILTAVPASPNDERQLYKITVKPKDIKNMLPAAAQAGLGEAKGPPWQVRVGPGHKGAKALVRWIDSRAADIEALFGVNDKEPSLDGLVLNHKEQAQVGNEAVSLTEIARSVAAGIYARFADHYEGEQRGHLNKLPFGGWVSELSHIVTTKGEGFTHAKMMDQLPEIPFRAFLDSGTRAILDREVQP